MSAIEPILRRLIEDGTQTCPVCDYDLQGLTSPVCPECGSRLEARLVTPDARIGWWLASVMAIALPFGFVTIFLLILYSMQVFQGQGAGRRADTGIMLAAVLALLLGALLAVRRPFLRLPIPLQRLVGSTAVVAGLFAGILLLDVLDA